MSGSLGYVSNSLDGCAEASVTGDVVVCEVSVIVSVCGLSSVCADGAVCSFVDADLLGCPAMGRIVFLVLWFLVFLWLCGRLRVCCRLALWLMFRLCVWRWRLCLVRWRRLVWLMLGLYWTDLMVWLRLRLTWWCRSWLILLFVGML